MIADDDANNIKLDKQRLTLLIIGR